MSKIRACIGKYATTPYRLGEEKIGIYCLEELCYYMVHNVELLEQEEMKQDLVEWIDMELGLRDLARDLLQIMRGLNTFVLFVSTILEYAHYLSHEDLVALREVLKVNCQMNPYERRKKRIDHKLQQGEYTGALSDYQSLLEQVGGRDLALTGDIYDAMGRAAQMLFLYDYAEQLFEKSYHLTYRKEALFHYILSVKLRGGSTDSRQKLSEIGSFPDLEAEADLQIEEIKRAYAESETRARATAFGTKAKDAEYYEQVAELSQSLKHEYRRSGE